MALEKIPERLVQAFLAAEDARFACHPGFDLEAIGRAGRDNLAAGRSPRMKTMLDTAVVLIDPCYNPDGHERYTVYYDSIAAGSPVAVAKLR